MTDKFRESFDAFEAALVEWREAFRLMMEAEERMPLSAEEWWNRRPVGSEDVS